MKIAVIDDLMNDSSLLISHLDKYFLEKQQKYLIDKFESGETFLSSFSAGEYDIIFLDIYMGGMTGIETAEKIREKDTDSAIVFLSTSNSFASESYDVNAFSYLIKPITYDTLSSLMERLIKFTGIEVKTLNVLYRSKPEIPLKINYDKIMYIDVEKKIVRIHLVNNTIEISNNFSECTDILLNDERFSNCCKGYIINFDYADSIDGNDFILENGERIPIKKRENHEVKKMYFTYKMKNIIS